MMDTDQEPARNARTGSERSVVGQIDIETDSARAPMDWGSRLRGVLLGQGRARTTSVAAQAGLFILFLLVGLAVGVIFSWATGHPPSVVIPDLIKGSVGSATSLTYTMTAATPLILVAVGTVICIRAGQFNIGQEGQVILGATGAAFVVLKLHESGRVNIPLAFAAAFVFGGAWAGLTAVLKFTRKVNIVVSSLLSVFLAEQLMEWMIGNTGPLHDSSGGTLGAATAAQSAPIPTTSHLPTVGIFGVEVPSGFIVAIAVAIVVVWMLRSTLLGYRIRILGESRAVARTLGINEARLGSLSIVLSGGFAGAAGAAILLGQAYQMHPGLSSNIGFTGLLIASAAQSRVGGAVAIAVVLGGLIAGGGILGSHNVPVDIVNVMNASVLVALMCPPLVLIAVRQYRIRRAAKAAA